MMLWQTAIDALTETWQIDCFCLYCHDNVSGDVIAIFVKQVQHNTTNAA